jgi:hypothetical protein
VARWLTSLSVTGAVAVLVLLIAWPESPLHRATGRRQQLPAGYDRLMSRLDLRHRTVLAEERSRQIEQWLDGVDALQAPLLWVLARPYHEHFADAAELAAALAIAEAADPLRLALDSSEPRALAPALRALDRLQPLDDNQIYDLVPRAATDQELAIALLECVASRPSPTPELLKAAIGLLQHKAPAVRDKALALLPQELPPQVTAQLLALIDDPIAGPCAIRLLQRVPPSSESVQAMIDRLAVADPEQQTAVLASIDRYAQTEPVRRLLWDLASGDGPTPLRAAALYGLERVRDPQPLPGGADHWPPLLRYHAARLRIATGNLDGIETLVDLIGAPGDAEPANDEERRAIAGARLALSRLARRAPHAGVQEFRDWFATLSAVPDVELQPPQAMR